MGAAPHPFGGRGLTWLMDIYRPTASTLYFITVTCNEHIFFIFTSCEPLNRFYK